ncbi:calcium-binding protein [Crenothrix sp.]|uniref:calcium-binding protein n=1 Tax=Crenothrix sp. TaxID=3100433 RepID=UPI00374DE522
MSKIYGMPTDDTLNGGLGDDEIYGLAGKDNLSGGAGNDVLYGGEGADTYLITSHGGRDVIENYDVDGSVDVLNFTDLLPSAITKAVRDFEKGTLTLTYGDSQVQIPYYFFGANYQINQFTFADGSVWQANDKAIADKLEIVKGTAGNDQIQGVFDWADRIDGLAGNDQLNGGTGQDTLLGGAGDDLLAGGEGNDNLQGGIGKDELYGGQGDDSLAGGAGGDLLVGEEGHDTLNGDNGDDKLAGANGNDSLNGGAGDDYLDGGIDNDILAGGAGKDTLLGGEGNDRYYITDLQDTIYETAGNDTVYVSVDDYKIPDGIENAVLAKNVRALPYFIDSLVSGGTQLGIGKAHSFTYSFVSKAQAEFKGFAPYSSMQQTAVRDALAKFSAVADVTFTEKTDAAAIDLRFFRDDLSFFNFQNAGGFGAYPPDSDVHINVKTQDMSLSNGVITGNFATLLHETGHALGMKHLFEKPILGGAEDNTVNSVMSYQSNKDYVVDLGLFDKATLHYLYGVNHNVRAGNDIYTPEDRYIWDGAGIDTLTASTQTLPVTINLKPGSWNYVGSKAASILAKNQFFIGHGSFIENATGGSGNDTLIGNERANTLKGGLGNDTLSGGVGNDTLLGGEGKDVLIGGLGKDSYILTETQAAQDTVRINIGDSSVAHFDKVSGFKLVSNGVLHADADKLDLPFHPIAKDNVKVNGINAGAIASHHISHGLISFDDNDNYAQALTISKSNFADVLRYVHTNIHTSGNTVVFNALNNSYVFQDSAAKDSLIELTGLTTTGLSTDGVFNGGIWIS